MADRHIGSNKMRHILLPEDLEDLAVVSATGLRVVVQRILSFSPEGVLPIPQVKVSLASLRLRESN
jgi:hypothetical protein